MTTPGDSWFDRLFDEFKQRGEAMFAFSEKQVEEAFDGDLAITWEQFKKEWVSVGAGLHVKRSAYVGFRHRMVTDFKAWEARQPEVVVQYVYTDTWDRPCYRVVSHDDGAPVHVGQVLKDTSLLPIGEAVTLDDHVEGEPNSALDIRVVYEQPLNTTADSSVFVHEEG
jgi:hypothetical protein